MDSHWYIRFKLESWYHVQAGLAIDWNYFVCPFRIPSRSLSNIPRKPYNSNFVAILNPSWILFFARKKDTYIQCFSRKTIPPGVGLLSKIDWFCIEQNLFFLTFSLSGLHPRIPKYCHDFCDQYKCNKKRVYYNTWILSWFLWSIQMQCKNERPAQTDFRQPKVLHARRSHLLNRCLSVKQARICLPSSEQTYQRLTSRAQNRSTGTPDRRICSMLSDLWEIPSKINVAFSTSINRHARLSHLLKRRPSSKQERQKLTLPCILRWSLSPLTSNLAEAQ